MPINMLGVKSYTTQYAVYARKRAGKANDILLFFTQNNRLLWTLVV